MAYVALLDADVLHPYLSVDLLLRLAERRMFRPAWSEEILAEVRNSLIRRGIDPHRVDRRVEAMRQAFPEAMTSGIGRFVSAAALLIAWRVIEPPRTPSGYEGRSTLIANGSARSRSRTPWHPPSTTDDPTPHVRPCIIATTA